MWFKQNDTDPGKMPDFPIDSNIREDHQQILLCLHGFGGDKESSVIAALRRELDSKGIGVAAFDWPAHGKSKEPDDHFTVEYCLAYLKKAVLTLRKLWPEKKISCFATSFGGYIAVLYWNRSENSTDFEKLILRSPALRMDKVFRKLIPDEEFKKLESGRKLTLGYERPMQIGYDFYEGLKKHSVDEHDLWKEPMSRVLILQGDRDDVVDHRDTLEYAKENGVRLKIFEGTDHRYKKPGELEKIIKYTEDLLLETGS